MASNDSLKSHFLSYNFLKKYSVKGFQHIRSLLLNNKESPTTTTSNNDNNESFSLISNFESQIVELQSLMMWDRPIISILALIYLTCTYWFVVFWEPRLISIVASIAFVYYFYEMWIQYVWPEIRAPSVEVRESWTPVNPNVLSAPEIQLYFQRIKILLIEFIDRIIQFRRRSHGAFCCYTIMFFLFLYYIGHFIPGVWIIYFTVNILFLTPGILVHIVTKNTLDVFFLKVLRRNQTRNENENERHIHIASPSLSDLDPYGLANTNKCCSSSPAIDPSLPKPSNISLSTTTAPLSSSSSSSLSGHLSPSEMFHTYENHFNNDPSSTSDSSSDSEFVMISDSELIDL